MADVVSEETGVQRSAKPEDGAFIRPKAKDIVVNQKRFGLAYFVLAIAVGVAVGLAIVLIGRGSTHHTVTNQGFKPKQSGELDRKSVV